MADTHSRHLFHGSEKCETKSVVPGASLRIEQRKLLNIRQL